MATLAVAISVEPSAPFLLLEPLSVAQAVLVFTLLASGLGIALAGPTPLCAGPQAAATAVLIVLHPRTALFGRDGALLLAGVHLVLVLTWLTSVRREWILAIATTLVTLAAAEAVLARVDRPPRAKLADYGDVMGPDGSGGFLRPGLDLAVVGEKAPVRFITERHGFRRSTDVTEDKPAGVLRVLFVGDSFVAGYRTDQGDTVGARLEQALRRRTGRDVQVLVAGEGHPAAARVYLRRDGLGFHPDLVLVGITLGNDVSQTWIVRRELPGDLLASPLLPRDAFKSQLALVPVRLDRSFQGWRLYRKLRTLLRPAGFTPWFADVPLAVHALDPGHSLGHFYVRRRLPLIEDSYAALLAELDDIRVLCAGKTALAFAILPQRFQVDASEWRAVRFDFGLDGAAFDLDAPDTRITSWCRASGTSCIDLLAAFRAAGPPVPYLPRGDMHWNARGHAIAAEALAEALAPRLVR
jgi:hypothetical protein